MSEALNPTDGTRIAYDRRGEGTPLVLVHGSALSKAIWRGLGYVRALADRYSVVTLDVRGHGRSGKPHRPEDYRMPLVLGDILAVLDAEGIESAHYAGYSFGGRAGFSLIAAHAERVRSFVSIGGTWRATAGNVADLFFPGVEDALERGGMREFLDRWGEASGAEIDAQTSAAFLANDPVALLAYFRQLETERGLEESVLASLTTPTLLLAGTRDTSRFEDSKVAASLMPDAAFLGLEGRGHGDSLRPAEGVIEPMARFFDAQPR